MTRIVLVPEALRLAIIDHCQAALPNEGCGMLALEGDRVMKVYPTANLDSSPISYTVPPQELFEAMSDAESRGWELSGAFHSHPTGPARMSATDLEKAIRGDWLYLVVGMETGTEIAGWRDGREVPLGR